MNGLMFGRVIPPPPRSIRFMGTPSQTEEHYQTVLWQLKKTLGNARNAKGHIEYPSAGESNPSERQQAMNAVAQEKFNLSYRLRGIMKSLSFFPVILLASLSGYTGYRSAVNFHIAKDQNRQEEVIANHVVPKAVGASVLSLLTGVFSITVLLTGLSDKSESYHYRHAWRALLDLWTERARLKKANRKTILLKPSEDPLEKRVLALMNQKINAVTERFAQRFQQKYRTVPDFQTFCHDLFGHGEAALPTAQGLRDMFEYYVYQHIQGQTPKPLKSTGAQPSELEFTQKLFAMICIGSKMGDVFRFMEVQPGSAGVETFNKAMLPEIEMMDQVIESQLGTVRELLQKELEVENYIALARKALMPLELGELDRKAEADQLKALIQEFGERQGKIQEALKTKIFQPDGNALFLDEALLTDLGSELTRFMTRLKAALLKEKNEDQLQQQVISLLCESSSLKTETPGVAPAYKTEEARK